MKDDNREKIQNPDKNIRGYRNGDLNFRWLESKYILNCNRFSKFSNSLYATNI